MPNMSCKAIVLAACLAQCLFASPAMAEPFQMHVTDVPLPDDEAKIRMGVQLQARVLFQMKELSQLNMMGRIYAGGVRTPAGTQKLQFFYNGLLDYAHSQLQSTSVPSDVKGWDALFRLTQEWIDTAPSPTAYIALAKFHRELAWQLRGPDTGDKMPAAALEPFRKQMQIAHDILASHKAEAASDPEWYVTMEELACEQEWPEDSSKALYEEAMANNIYYDRVYYAIATRLEPVWGGTWEQIERFADSAARKTNDKLGDILYARIYMWTADCYCEAKDGKIWNWDRIKSSFQDLQSRYPDPWNDNKFAYYACRQRDKAAAKDILGKLPRVIPSAWDDGDTSYEQCKAWVAT